MQVFMQASGGAPNKRKLGTPLDRTSVCYGPDFGDDYTEVGCVLEEMLAGGESWESIAAKARARLQDWRDRNCQVIAAKRKCVCAQHIARYSI